MRVLSAIETLAVSGGYSEEGNDDIVVTGSRDIIVVAKDDYLGFGSNYGLISFHTVYDEWGGGGGSVPQTPSVPDCQSQDFDESQLTGELNNAEKSGLENVKNSSRSLIGAAGSQPSDTTISVDGLSFNMREVFVLLSKADYVLRDAGSDYGNDVSGTVQGGGAADRNNGNPIISVNVDLLVNRGLQSPEAAAFYLLHEIVHTTTAFWNARPSSDATVEQKTAYEQQTNVAALALAAALGINMHGYNPPLGVGDKRATTQQGSEPPAGARPVCGG